MVRFQRRSAREGLLHAVIAKRAANGQCNVRKHSLLLSRPSLQNSMVPTLTVRHQRRYSYACTSLAVTESLGPHPNGHTGRVTKRVFSMNKNRPSCQPPSNESFWRIIAQWCKVVASNHPKMKFSLEPHSYATMRSWGLPCPSPPACFNALFVPCQLFYPTMIRAWCMLPQNATLDAARIPPHSRRSAVCAPATGQ